MFVVPFKKERGFILGISKENVFIKEFININYPEILFGKIKEKTLKGINIIEMEDVIYKFGSKIYSFADSAFKEFFIGKIIEKKELYTPKKYKYKISITTFLNEHSQKYITRYMVEPI